ncbi:MAG: hypothetical protein ABIN89_00185 [Chitinophagaceae bacterium]
MKKIAGRLSKDLNTTVKINNVNLDFAFFNKMSLEGTLITDRRNDTLLYAGGIKVRLTDWFFLKDTLSLKYIGLEDATVYMHRVDSVWNYQFLADYFSGPPSATRKKSINLDLKVVALKNITFLRKDEWRGEDMFFHVRFLDLDAKQINLAKKNIDINSFNLIDPFFSIYNYKGNRPPPPPRIVDSSVVKNDSSLKWNPDGWKLSINKVTVNNGILKSSQQINRQPYYYFDGANILFSSINSTFKNVLLNKDTVTANLFLSTKERSGFDLKSLHANFKMHPQGMEFADLDIITNKSRLRNYFAMSYDQFDDMNHFIEKVQMAGNLKNSEIESDDIAFFAPEVKTWEKRIFITGIIKGSVANLSTKNITIRAGNNTILNGDIKMVGLPDIEKTFIDFKANDLRTTYKDAVAFVPSLKSITEPRLDRIQTLQYKGYYTGFIRDFVTFGTVTTNLGVIGNDIIMKLPKQGGAIYSGTLITPGFDIGQLLDNSNLGKIAFNGKVKGNGFSFRTLQAELDGDIQTLEFNNYRYSNLKVKGTLAKRLFNGEFTANDTNLVAQLNGLIDFSLSQPQFDFAATIEKSNLKRLNLYKDDIDINGDILFKFTGSTIDNFLGSAKVFNASIYKDGQRLSFDSLTLESEIVAETKTIKVFSNEFDAILVGDFSIKELPDAFQTFLNRYYPSYINPSQKKITNENFSFVITTKKIDDYIGLFDQNLKGFNFSNLNGRINLQNNLFELDAEVPNFAYKKTAFNNVVLQGRGNLDTLSLNTKIADVFVNDSLHFPTTEIDIQSSQDISKVDISTSANQTLNSASISGQVKTLKDGVSIIFNPSTFDINGKRWTIDKDGELVLSRQLVSTDHLRIYNEEQEIFITSEPSSVGNNNDLKMALKKINIGDFSPFFTKDNRIEGLLSGIVHISDPLGNLHVDVKADAQQFRLDDDSMGSIQINSNYTKATGKINANVVSANYNFEFDLNAVFNTQDSATQDIDININLENTSIHLLEKYLSDIFGRLSGKATGKLQVVGPARDLKYLGDIQLKDGGFLVNYTKCYYRVPSAVFKFTEGSIDFGSFTIKDTLNNSAEIVGGRLDHRAFKDLVFDFHLKSNRLLLLNTTSGDNNQFYGKMIGKVNMNFTGPLEDMQMDIKGEPTDTSNIYLPIGSSRESGDAGFIVWKVYGREMQAQDLKFRESNLTVSLDVTANKYANIFVILDALTGDIIEATGTGNIKLRAGTREDMTMNGRFNIEKGNYTFTFQAIKRKFKLLGNAGSYISWNGNPTAARIDIEAEYEAENVRFSDLLNGSKLSNYASEDVKRFRGKVLVIATLTERLTEPTIAFRIELPPNSPIKSNQDVATILSFVENDVNELNKQVSFLILFNTFGPYSGGGAQGGGTGDLANKAIEGIVVNSISGFLSNIVTKEFSDVLQNIFNDKSLKFNFNASIYSGSNLLNNYNPNQVTLPDRTSLNLTIEKSYFNERLTFIVGGALDFGLNTVQQNQSSSFPFLPDVTAEWLLTPDGKFRLTFFYRENYSYIGTTGGKQNRAGTSISYRKEFDRVDEIFKKKKKPQPDGNLKLVPPQL